MWLTLVGPEGLAAQGTTADADRLWGDVVHHEPGHSLQLTVDPWADGLVTIAVEGDEDDTLVWATVATFGQHPDEPADRLATRLRPIASSDG